MISLVSGLWVMLPMMIGGVFGQGARVPHLPLRASTRLQLTAIAEPPSAPLGGGVVLKLRLKNVTSKVIRVIDSGFDTDYDLDVTDRSGNVVAKTDVGVRLVDAPLLRSTARDIPPGDQVPAELESVLHHSRWRDAGPPDVDRDGALWFHVGHVSGIPDDHHHHVPFWRPPGLSLRSAAMGIRGQPPYTWSVAPGSSLAPGLSLTTTQAYTMGIQGFALGQVAPGVTGVAGGYTVTVPIPVTWFLGFNYAAFQAAGGSLFGTCGSGLGAPGVSLSYSLGGL